MRASIPLLALGASLASAQYYANQSAPFNLQVVSSNSTLNNTILSPCHEGAALEGLCVSSLAVANYSIYNFNYTTQMTPDPVLGYTGLVTYELRGGNFNLSSPLNLQYSPTSNIAAPLFTPSGDDGQLVGFDQEEMMYIGTYVDDSVSPPKSMGLTPVYQWAACTTNFGYTYHTLAWIVGKAAVAQNPTCQTVGVKRVFV